MSSSKNVAVALAHIEKRRKLESTIAELEDRIFVLESSYFEETGAFNIVRGWDGFKRAPLSIKKQGGSTRACDRILSLSSLTSPCGELPWPKESEFLGASKALLTEKKTAKKPQQSSSKKSHQASSTTPLDGPSTASSPFRQVDSNSTLQLQKSSPSISTLDEVLTYVTQTGKVELPPGFKLSHRRGEGRSATLQKIAELTQKHKLLPPPSAPS
jgi:hypothetical protein